MILSDRGYAVKERGIMNVKGKGNMRTYFILGRKISRRHGRGSGAANNSLAEVVYGMVRARRRRMFKRERGCDSELVTKDQDTGSVTLSNGTSKLNRNNPIRRSLRRLNTMRGGKSPIVDVSKCKSEFNCRISLDIDSKDPIC